MMMNDAKKKEMKEMEENKGKAKTQYNPRAKREERSWIEEATSERGGEHRQSYSKQTGTEK